MSKKVYILKSTRFSNESVYYYPTHNIAAFETEEDVRKELDRIAEEELNKEEMDNRDILNYGDRVVVEFAKDEDLIKRWGIVYEYDAVDFYKED